jgi:hypothetical protein
MKRKESLGVISADGTQARTDIREAGGKGPDARRNHRLPDTRACCAFVGAIAPRMFGAQQIAAPPSIGDFYDAATSALMVALEDNTVPFCGRSKFRLERLEGQYCRFPYRNTFED